MHELIINLTKKYGQWHSEHDYIYNCIVEKYSSSLYLNVIFNNPEYKKNESVLKEYGVNLIGEMEHFYKKFNGFTLFCGSFCVYGYKDGFIPGKHSPVSTVKANTFLRLRFKNWRDEFVAIGECSVLNFCVKKNNKDETIYVINRFTNKLLKTFSTFYECINYYIDKLSKIYDENGVKITAPKDSKLPIHNMCDEKDLME